MDNPGIIERYQIISPKYESDKYYKLWKTKEKECEKFISELENCQTKQKEYSSNSNDFNNQKKICENMKEEQTKCLKCSHNYFELYLAYKNVSY